MDVVVFHQVQQMKRHVGCVGAKGIGGDLAGLLSCLGFGGASTQITQSHQTPIVDHALGGFRYGAEYTSYLSEICPNGTIGEREVAFFAWQITVEDQLQVLRPCGLAGVEYAIEHRADDLPDLVPAFLSRRPQRPGMFRAEDRNVGVVVENGELTAPEDDDGKAGAEADADGSLQARRPGIWRRQNGFGPIEGAHPRAHLAAREDFVLCRGGLANYISSRSHEQPRDCVFMPAGTVLSDTKG